MSAAILPPRPRRGAPKNCCALEGPNEATSERGPSYSVKPRSTRGRRLPRMRGAVRCDLLRSPLAKPLRLPDLSREDEVDQRGVRAAVLSCTPEARAQPRAYGGFADRPGVPRGRSVIGRVAGAGAAHRLEATVSRSCRVASAHPGRGSSLQASPSRASRNGWFGKRAGSPPAEVGTEGAPRTVGRGPGNGWVQWLRSPLAHSGATAGRAAVERSR